MAGTPLAMGSPRVRRKHRPIGATRRRAQPLVIRWHTMVAPEHRLQDDCFAHARRRLRHDEALAILKGVAKEGIAAMEAVEVSPPYDISDITALIAVRAMVDVLATMVKHDRIGGKLR